MKIIEFIKRNISVFNTISVLIFFYLINFIVINKFNDNDNHLIFIIIAFIIFIVFCFFLLVDFLLKKIISSRLKLNFIELIITIILISLIYIIKYNL